VRFCYFESECLTRMLALFVEATSIHSQALSLLVNPNSNSYSCLCFYYYYCFSFCTYQV